jgi:hypothetical protein
MISADRLFDLWGAFRLPDSSASSAIKPRSVERGNKDLQKFTFSKRASMEPRSLDAKDLCDELSERDRTVVRVGSVMALGELG